MGIPKDIVKKLTIHEEEDDEDLIHHENDEELEMGKYNQDYIQEKTEEL